MEPSAWPAYMHQRNRELPQVSRVRFSAVSLAAALGVAGLWLSPALATGSGAKSPPAVSLSLNPDFQFTPASADPRLAAAFSAHSASLGDFKFTPAAAKGRPSQVRVAIRAHATTPEQLASNEAESPAAKAIAPVSYNLGVAVGWRRFAIAGDVAKVKPASSPIDGRESATVGVSYSLPRFTGRVALSADKSQGTAAPPLRDPDTYALDLGGSYALSRRLSVTGGVRYNIQKDRASTLSDNRVDSQAVYIGTAFKF
jgi:hypothetical protein